MSAKMFAIFFIELSKWKLVSAPADDNKGWTIYWITRKVGEAGKKGE